MRYTIIHKNNLSDQERSGIAQLIGGDIVDKSGFHVIRHDQPVALDVLKQVREKYRIDINSVPEGFDPQNVKLMISDMDSTLISIECVDEIADFMQVKDKVSAITEAAMRGEIDFATSLQRRVALLDGLPESVLVQVYEERLRLNPGAEKLISGLQAKGIKTALVSGGFTFFTERLRQRLGLDYSLANVLEVEQQHLTGKVMGEIVTGSRKAGFLEKICAEQKLDLNQSIAIGDGANDLEMLSKAGLGVAYHAKPIVQDQADVALNYNGLDAILHFLDY